MRALREIPVLIWFSVQRGWGCFCGVGGPAAQFVVDGHHGWEAGGDDAAGGFDDGPEAGVGV